MSLRLAAQESTLPGDTLEERFAAAQSYGFDGIELGAQGDGRFAARADELARARANGVVEAGRGRLATGRFLVGRRAVRARRRPRAERARCPDRVARPCRSSQTRPLDGAGRLPTRIPTLLEPDPRVPFEPESLLIVRPDGYVGLSASRDAWGEARPTSKL